VQGSAHRFETAPNRPWDHLPKPLAQASILYYSQAMLVRPTVEEEMLRSHDPSTRTRYGQCGYTTERIWAVDPDFPQLHGWSPP